MTKLKRLRLRSTLRRLCDRHDRGIIGFSEFDDRMGRLSRWRTRQLCGACGEYADEHGPDGKCCADGNRAKTFPKMGNAL